MQTAQDRDRRAISLAILGVLAITAVRIALQALNATDLFVDESQYWLWGQSFDFGYYSKPPMIAWVIRLATEIGGSDAPFWVRVPGPVFHAATGLILMAVARRLHGDRVGAVTALAYVTLPLATAGSLVISTDTMLFPFFAGALFFWVRLLDRPAARDAVLGGLCLGLGFLSKYAAIYFLISAALAAALHREWRPGWGMAALFGAGFLVAAAPNLIWNIATGGSTVSHTLDNADWVRDPAERAGLNLPGLAEFVAAQFLFFGPVVMGALLWSAWRWGRGRAGRWEALMLVFALPVILIICGQALISRAYANWAAVAYLGGTLAVVPLLWHRARRWLWVSFAVHGLIALALPLASITADRLSLDGENLLLARVLGRAALSERIIDTARAQGADTVVATHRDVLADLFHTGRESGLTFRAIDLPGPARHHYEMSYPYTGAESGPVLLATFGERPPGCPSALAGRWTVETGAYAGRMVSLYTVAPNCADLLPR
ncbi:ArnT family glycosyltransferase [Rhodovulum sp. YNF3179]|uniref:ArnT family glycosyltransferase n=1 Tax=Rhodovulum sp. YNF3179 TaxID=3425127 RepID=UPI003D352C42